LEPVKNWLPPVELHHLPVAVSDGDVKVAFVGVVIKKVPYNMSLYCSCPISFELLILKIASF
jgi:hypothetical protein